jgi:hypothetical protein
LVGTKCIWFWSRDIPTKASDRQPERQQANNREVEFLVEKPEIKPVYFPVSSRFLPGSASWLNTIFLVILGRLSRFHPGFSSLCRFLPVLKRGLGSRFRLVL